MGFLTALKNESITDVTQTPDVISRTGHRSLRAVLLIGTLAVLCGLAFAWMNPNPEGHFDYQFRIATALLSGHLGLRETEGWLSEMIPYEGWYYSAFPLGSVLCMIPVALIQKLRGIPELPVREVIGMLAGALSLFAIGLSGRYRDPVLRRGMLVTVLLFGSWLACNAIFGNAWELALTMAATGEFMALFFILVYRQPLLAGLGFAIAFGNRTEIVLLAPLLLYLLMRTDPFRDGETTGDALKASFDLRTHGRDIAAFLLVPFLLGVGTLWYNYARFHSPLDFGYTHIPNMMKETWYRFGLFSLHAVPMNVHAMLLNSSWEPRDNWPYLRPALFGGSIFTACPYLLILLRAGGRDRILRNVSWLAIGVLSVALLTHGNAGGVQYSYRYAIVLLPWIYLLWLEQRGGKILPLEWGLYLLSIASSAWAIYLFHWAKAVGMF